MLLQQTSTYKLLLDSLKQRRQRQSNPPATPVTPEVAMSSLVGPNAVDWVEIINLASKESVAEFGNRIWNAAQNPPYANRDKSEIMMGLQALSSRVYWPSFLLVAMTEKAFADARNDEANKMFDDATRATYPVLTHFGVTPATASGSDPVLKARLKEVLAHRTKKGATPLNQSTLSKGTHYLLGIIPMPQIVAILVDHWKPPIPLPNNKLATLFLMVYGELAALSPKDPRTFATTNSAALTQAMRTSDPTRVTPAELLTYFKLLDAMASYVLNEIKERSEKNKNDKWKNFSVGWSARYLNALRNVSLYIAPNVALGAPVDVTFSGASETAPEFMTLAQISESFKITDITTVAPLPVMTQVTQPVKKVGSTRVPDFTRTPDSMIAAQYRREAEMTTRIKLKRKAQTGKLPQKNNIG